MSVKKYISVSTALALSSIVCAADPVRPQTATNTGMQNRASVESLQKQINDLQKEIEDLQERSDENELQATLNKVKFGLEFSQSAFSVGSSETSPTTGVESKYHNSGKFATEVHLNMNAAINERTKFTGRLSVTKGWGDMQWGGYTPTYLPTDFDAGRSLAGGTGVYLERAYIDYILYDGLVASAGRMPATDGPGSNLRNNSARMSTYPALLVNILGDALVLTYAPPSLEDYKLTFRGGYSKIYQSVNGSGTSDHFLGAQKDADSDMLFGQVEVGLPLGSAVGDNLMILSYLTMLNYTTPVNTSALSVGPVNMGDAQIMNFYFENNRPFGVPLNWFVAAGYYKTTPNSGDDATYKVTNGAVASKDVLDQLIASGAGASNPTLTQAQSVVNLLRANEDSSWSLHLGARYDLPLNFKIGYEYFHGSRYWFALSRSSINDPLDFRNTRGDVHDVYLIYQMDFNQFLRASYTNIHNKYSNHGLPFGGAEPVDRTAEVFMLMYNVKF